MRTLLVTIRFSNLCSQCTKNPTKFTFENDMKADYNIPALQILTLIEKSLLSSKVNVLKIFIISFNIFSHGNVILLRQNPASTVEAITMLPRKPNDAGFLFLSE